MIDINLLPPQNILSQKERSLRTILIKILSGLTIIVVLSSGIIFAVKIYYDDQVVKQTQKRDQLTASFKEEAATASKVRTLKDKISGVKIIQDSQTNFAVIVKKIQEVAQDTSLKSFTVDSDGRILLSASTDNITSLDNFISNITFDANNPFSKTTMSGLRRDPGGGYSYSINTQYIFSKVK